MMVYLRNVDINILLELSEFPSLFGLFCNRIIDVMIHEDIGKNFEAPKEFYLIIITIFIYIIQIILIENNYFTLILL
jgi:hypothetical protein